MKKYLPSCISANTIVALRLIKGKFVAAQVKIGVITSSPPSIPIRWYANSNADVPEFKPKQNL